MSITVENYMRKIYSSAKSSAKTRSNKGRLEAGKINITLEYLYNQWNLQSGLCYYSNIPLIRNKFSDWQASLERKNPELGYIKGNVVFCSLELNCFKQWTYQKIYEMFNILNNKIEFNYQDINFDFIRKQFTLNKIEKEIRNDIEYVKCNSCKNFKSRNHFNIKINAGCKECISKNDKERLKNPRAALMKLIKSARGDSKNREKRKIKQERTYDFDIDLEYLIKLYKEQKGLCAYSGIPMRFGSYKDINWTISLERINSLKGYTKENVCLICIEFNTLDRSSLTEKETNGSCSWSKDKFEIFMTGILISL